MLIGVEVNTFTAVRGLGAFTVQQNNSARFSMFRADRDPCFINPWPSRPLLGDEQLPLMSVYPVAALPNARLPPATRLIAQWGA